MCPGRPYMLGGGTSLQRAPPPRRSWRSTSKASGPLLADVRRRCSVSPGLSVHYVIAFFKNVMALVTSQSAPITATRVAAIRAISFNPSINSRTFDPVTFCTASKA
jgi:hypothetical protein